MNIDIKQLETKCKDGGCTYVFGENDIKILLNDEVLLTISYNEKNKTFTVYNNYLYYNGECKKIDDYKISYTIFEHKRKNKKGFFQKAKILDGGKWFPYILQEYGLIQKQR